MKNENENDITISDFGNFDVPDLDLDNFDLNLDAEADTANRFQLAVAFVHTKTVHFETLGGEKIVIHGSANLRTSGNVEQFTIEENAELYDFYNEAFSQIIERFNRE